MYAYIENEEVTRTGRLPKTWTKKDGTTVSGFHLLPEDEIKAEGWISLVEDKPEFDPDTHYLQISSYDIKEDKVIRRYEVIELPAEESEPGMILENHLLDLDYRVSKMELGL
ncbi:hypothetical protein M3689_01140 [Alkalihalophilus marmarensis]|jgi:hypothetical protein|uniref:hypothetical protein n=1 Tax=Alkalihalophilus marmarensis TaxID=521377 RepID=UPI00203EE438|nr:hypothetical protein [Alkalihalophilus marmarensis]MCM3487904.1 hypothetical protein [Alkalihalophilus marmarensis]